VASRRLRPAGVRRRSVVARVLTGHIHPPMPAPLRPAVAGSPFLPARRRPPEPGGLLLASIPGRCRPNGHHDCLDLKSGSAAAASGRPTLREEDLNEKTRARVERLLGRKTERNVNGCLEWTGATNGKGYGRIGVDGRMMAAHRVVWQLVHGILPTGMLVCHRCDNRRCVEETHLFVGSARDNALDAISKGRAPQLVSAAPGGKCGEANSRARLTRSEVATIRLLLADGLSQRAIAAKYRVGQSTVRDILQHKTWQHVPLPELVTQS
jgi:predicted DNA-binding protein (UPF0251 family)